MSELGRKLARILAVQDSLRSVILAALMIGLSGLVSYALLGTWGVVLAAALVTASAAVRANGELLLKVQRARPLAPHEVPQLSAIVHALSKRAAIVAPHVYLLPAAAPNALATETSDGRGALALTRGLLHRLSGEELEGVLAHEISHLKNGDTRLSRWTSAAAQSATTLLQVAVWLGLITTLLSGEGLGGWLMLLLMSWLAPIVFGVMQSALSRTREFAADTNAIELTGRPWALASALEKLERASTPWFRILLGQRRASGWLDSHPATADRVARLKSLSRGASIPAQSVPPTQPMLFRVERVWH